MIRLTPGLPDRDYLIPGSTSPVRLARLHVRPDGGSTSLVRFPPGWTRPARGHYLAGEEFVVLDGTLHVSGITYRDGDYGWIPAGSLRFDSESPAGALAVALFDGPPAWVGSDGDAGQGAAVHASLRTMTIPDGGLTIRPGTVLMAGGTPIAPCEALTMGDRGWNLIEKGEPLPRGRVLLWGLGA